MAFADTSNLKKHELAHAKSGDLVKVELKVECVATTDGGLRGLKASVGGAELRLRPEVQRLPPMPLNAAAAHCCAICGAQFAQAIALQEHAIKHVNDVNSTCRCEICNKTFVHEMYLKAHVALHVEHRPHACAVCGKCFKNASHLKSHESVHTGMKPHCCAVCGKSFAKASSLRRHQVIHERADPILCTVCGKRFPGEKYLRQHALLHAPSAGADCATAAGGERAATSAASPRTALEFQATSGQQAAPFCG